MDKFGLRRFAEGFSGAARLFGRKATSWRQRVGVSVSNHRSDIIPISIILTLGIIPLTWFRGMLISSMDFGLPPNLDQSFSRMLHVWDEVGGLGLANPRVVAEIVPLGVAEKLTSLLNISPLVLEKAVFYIWFAGAGLSVYYLVSVLMRGRRERVLASAVAGVFYMINPYALTFVWSSATPYAFFYAFLPLVLGLFVKGLREGRGLRFAFLICIVWLVTLNGSNVNPRFAVFSWAILLAYLVFHLLTAPGSSRRQAVYFTGILGIVWLGINSYWLVPLVAQSQQAFTQSAFQNIGTDDMYSYNLNSTSILDAFRMGGYWPLGQGYRGDPYAVWGQTYLSPLFVGISFAIPVLALVGFLLRSRYWCREPLFFLSLALASVFIIKGSNPPLSQVNELITDNALLLRLFRAPTVNVGVFLALSYAFLIGWSVSAAYYRIGDIRRSRLWNRTLSLCKNAMLVVIAVLLCVVYAYPYWTGDIIYPGGRVIPSARYAIPDYYWDAGRWLEAQEGDFRILDLPFSKIGYSAYSWDNGYFGATVVPWLSSHPAITSANAAGSSLLLQVAGDLSGANAESGNSSDSKTLALLNVKYVLFHRDTDWAYVMDHPWWICTSQEEFQVSLENQQGLRLEASFGQLDFYLNEEWRPAHIYGSSGATNADGSLATLAAFDISYERRDSTGYSIHVKTAEPFYLVFSDSFDAGWKAYVNDEGDTTNWIDALYQKPVSEENHLLVNGYANAWYVDKTGEYDITLYFVPQSFFCVGVVVSVLSLFGVGGYVAWYVLLRKKRQVR